jgi:hypothetical protein
VEQLKIIEGLALEIQVGDRALDVSRSQVFHLKDLAGRPEAPETGQGLTPVFIRTMDGI